MTVGKVGRAHGLRGAFFVSGRDEPIPAAYGEVRIGEAPETSRPTRIRSSQMQGERPLLLCTLAENRNAAEALTGQWIYVDAGRAQRVAAGDVLWSDLEGAAVVDAAGAALGRVHHVYNAGASDVIEIRDGRGRSVDLPVVPGYIELPAGLSGEPGKRVLQLAVTADVLDEVWQDKPAPKAPKPPKDDDGA